MEFNAVEARKHIQIHFVDKDYSKFALFPLVASFCIDYLHLDRAFNLVLKVKKSNSSFSESEYLLTVLSIILLGIPHLYKSDIVLASERTLAKSLGIRNARFPSSGSLYRLLGFCTRGSVSRLNEINFSLIKKHKSFFFSKRWLTMDIDQTKKLTEGKSIERAAPTYHAHKKGKLGLRISASVVEGLIFSQKLEPGNVGNADAFEEIFDKTLDQLNHISDPIRANRVRLKKIILRIDGGYYSAKTLNRIEEERKTRDVEFIIRAPINNKLVKEEIIYRKKQQKMGVKKFAHFPSWEHITDDCQVLRLNDVEVLDEVSHTYTVLLVKQTQHRIISEKKKVKEKKVVVEYLLVTTLANWNTKRILKHYKKRQTIENVFKDFNQSFAADKLPSHTFYGNAFFFQMVALASTISFFFKAHSAFREVSHVYSGYPQRQTYLIAG